MSEPATQPPPLTLEDYLRLEESGVVRHEYVAGRIYALTGVSKRHNRIALNLASRLLEAARGGPCRVYVSDVRLRAAEDVVYYPDVMVACGPVGADPLVEEAPCLVVEITSPSSETTDRREKVVVYRRIASLEAYLVVDQDRRRVERHWRDGEGVWRHGELTGEDRVPIPCPESELSFDEIYAGAETADLP